MKKMDIERAAAVLVNARRTRTHLQGLPDGLKPTTVDEAYAIQAAVSRQLGKLIAGFKAIVPPGEGPTIAMLYGGTIHASPATMPVRDVPHCGVEAEVAFRFNRDFPARATPYSLDEVAALADPLGEGTSWVRPNGLQIQRVRVPLGVIAIIYEARPNVTADAAGICLKAGNAVLLRGSSSARATSSRARRSAIGCGRAGPSWTSSTA